jgi:archaetidylinositol phosphate synthase
MESTGFKDAKRKQTSFLAPIEKIALIWLAGRMPARLNPDHLSIIGLIAMFMAGLFYFFSKWNPLFFHLVNISLIINWFGDSLDGTLARYRNKQRPRYGFYVDHIIDAFGTLFLIGGLALSGYMTERIALIMLIIYFMLSINSYLATYALGTFSISFWKFSPTELRLLLGIGNIALIYHPHSRILGQTYLLYDIGGIIGIAGMSLMLIVSAVRNTKRLYRLERV